MIDSNELEGKIKSSKIDNSYIFCGVDESSMKEKIKHISEKVLESSFYDLNYIQFDGTTLNMDNVLDTCNTVPFMSDKKVVVIYRAKFLGDSEDREDKKRYDYLNKYLDNVPEHCVLIIYYVFQDDREKPSDKLKKLDKKSCVVKFDKIKGAALEKRIREYFEKRGKDIGKVELKLFCDGLENNMNVIENEVEKLCTYTIDREIKKEDILIMLPPKSDNDIFDLVDSLALKKAEKAIDILNELIFKGEKVNMILFMVERQFNLLLNLMLGVEEGKSKDTLAKELRLNPYICEKMITQSRKFTTKQIRKAIEHCLNTEERLKSSSANPKTEMELLIVNTITA